jgi:lipopolysaccharide assembly outer membrane protein LptD (OstA)
MARITVRKAMSSPAWPVLVALAALAAALTLAPLVLGQDQAPTPPSAKADDAAPPPEATDESEQAEEKAAEEEEEPVHVENADHMRYDAEKGLYFLTGNVHFRHKDGQLYCDEAQYDEENDTARAVGHLKLVTPDTTVTGDLITADFDEEIADITGNVRLITQRKKKTEDEKQEGAEKAEGAEPKPEDAGAEEGDEKPKKLDEYREKLTTVTCEKIRYWYEEKRALATGNIVAVQEDKTCYADEGTYLEEEEMLTLVGSPVRVVMENGNRFQANQVKVDVASDRIWTEGGPFSGFFKREKKKEEEGEGEPAAPAAEEQPAGETEASPAPE